MTSLRKNAFLSGVLVVAAVIATATTFGGPSSPAASAAATLLPWKNNGVDNGISTTATTTSNTVLSEFDDYPTQQGVQRLRRLDDHEDHTGHDHGDEEEEEETDDHAGHDHGDDHDDHDDHEDSKDWGAVIIAALLINLATLTGLVVMTGQTFLCGKKNSSPETMKRWVHNIIPSFACGALLATTLFLILPEALAMIKGQVTGEGHAHRRLDDHSGHGHDDDLYDDHVFHDDDDDNHDGHSEEEEEEMDTESAVAARFGCAVLGGFLLPMLSGFLFHYDEEAEELKAEERAALTAGKSVDVDVDIEKTAAMTEKPEAPIAVVEKEATDGEEGVEASSAPAAAATTNAAATTEDDNASKNTEETELTQPRPKAINWSLASAILIGDFFHNFTDGVLVGTAFLLCDRDLAITISVATVYHELAQEVADFFMLTEHCHMSVPLALGLNFVGGLSVLLGAIMIFSFDISSGLTGAILAVGGGVYIHLAAAECLPRALKSHKTPADKGLSVLAFVLGVIPIGLVLINHGHCEEGHEDH